MRGIYTYPPYSGSDAPKWDGESPKTWDEWTDPLGQVYKPGDYVAVATINGKSPQMVICKVVRINRVDSKGHLICAKTSRKVDAKEGEPGARQDRKWDAARKTQVDTGVWYRLEYDYPPLCTVTAYPIIDGRGFGRYGDVKNSTYRLPGNIIKVDGSVYEAQMAALADDLADLRDELA